MAQNDERAPIELDEQQLKKNPLWNHVVLLEKASSGGNAIWKCKYCTVELLESKIPLAPDYWRWNQDMS